MAARSTDLLFLGAPEARSPNCEPVVEILHEDQLNLLATKSAFPDFGRAGRPAHAGNLGRSVCGKLPVSWQGRLGVMSLSIC